MVKETWFFISLRGLCHRTQKCVEMSISTISLYLFLFSWFDCISFFTLFFVLLTNSYISILFLVSYRFSFNVGNSTVARQHNVFSMKFAPKITHSHWIKQTYFSLQLLFIDQVFFSFLFTHLSVNWHNGQRGSVDTQFMTPSPHLSLGRANVHNKTIGWKISYNHQMHALFIA